MNILRISWDGNRRCFPWTSPMHLWPLWYLSSKAVYARLNEIVLGFPGAPFSARNIFHNRKVKYLKVFADIYRHRSIRLKEAVLFSCCVVAICCSHPLTIPQRDLCELAFLTEFFVSSWVILQNDRNFEMRPRDDERLVKDSYKLNKYGQYP